MSEESPNPEPESRLPRLVIDGPPRSRSDLPQLKSHWWIVLTAVLVIGWVAIPNEFAASTLGLIAALFPVTRFAVHMTRDPPGHVTRQFGLAEMLGLTVAGALLFSLLRWSQAQMAELVYCLATPTLAAAAQFRYPRDARGASVVAGGICGGLSIAIFGHDVIVPDLCDTASGVLLGALGGYLFGCCLAGVFLLTDLIRKHFGHGRKPSAPPATPRTS